MPFDRHDWYVDRCGKKIRYIIDYYATENEDGESTYYCDCRPAPTFGGIVDRLHMSWNLLCQGKSFRDIW